MIIARLLCRVLGHDWRNRGFAEDYIEVNHNEAGDGYDMLATFRRQICVRGCSHDLPSRNVYVHHGAMTDEEKRITEYHSGE